MGKNRIIYHGSVSIVDHPEYGKGKIHNDYGLGFYCTEDLALAKEWAVGDGIDGYANCYCLDLRGLKVLDLGRDATVLHWITILLQHRVFHLKSDISKTGKRFLIDHYSLPVDQYDVIKGYRADDSYFAYAEDFLNNAISLRRLEEALKLGRLGEQIVLKSKRAFGQIAFLSYEEAKAEIYYPLRQQRNLKARQEFLNNRKGGIYPEDIFLIDLMRREGL